MDSLAQLDPGILGGGVFTSCFYLPEEGILAQCP